MRCAIVQPSYIPWRGSFDLIARADLFVFYDDVQYDHRGWRNRNRIKTPHGTRWLTVPVHPRRIPICEIETVDSDWPRRHLAALTRSYGKAPHFDEFRPWLERVYAEPPRLLADFTISLTLDILALLDIHTPTLRSTSLNVSGAKTERLLAVLRAVGATRYLSGPSARAYLDVELLERAGIEVEWMTYDVPEYPQLYPPFDPHVTVLDFLFMAGAGGLKPALR